MEYAVPLSLQRICITRVAQYLWEKKQESVEKLQYFFRYPRQKPKNEMWNLLTRDVIKSFKFKGLSDELYSDIVYTIYCMKERRIEWLKHLESSYVFRDISKEDFFSIYAKKISWTYCATVDEEKTIRSWLDIEGIDLGKTFIMACHTCSELLIKEIWQKILGTPELSKINENDVYETHFAAYWIRSFENSLKNFIKNLKNKNCDPLNIYNENESVEGNMLRLALRWDFQMAAKYFLSKVNEVEKEKVIFEYFKDKQLFQNRYQLNYKNFQVKEIQIFLWVNMTEDLKRSLLELKHFDNWVSKIIVHPIGALPVHFQIFISDNFKKYISGSEYQEFHISMASQNNDIFNRSLKLPVKGNIFQNEFHKMWKVAPLNSKERIAKKVANFMFQCWDVLNLKMILNDEFLNSEQVKLSISRTRVEKNREVLIKHYGGYDKFLDLIEEKNQEKIDQFISEILIPDAWKNDKQHTMQKLYKYVMQGEFDMAELLHKSKSPQNLKNKIDPELMCYYFIRINRLDWADKFLLWALGSRESLKAYKKALSSDKFLAEHIKKLWTESTENVEKIKCQCNHFLYWCFESNELANSFIRENFAKYYIDYSSSISYVFFEKERFEVIDDFLKWSGLTKKQISACKNKSFPKHTMFELMEKYMGENKIETAKKLLDCVFKSEEEKIKFIKNFFSKNAPIFACKYFISENGMLDVFEPKLSQEEIANSMKEFINFWMKPVKVFAKLKMGLEKWPKLCEEEIKLFMKSNSCSESHCAVNTTKAPDRNNFPNYDDYLNASWDYNDENKKCFVYCEKENLRLFMRLLRCFEVNSNQFCCSFEKSCL